MYTKNYGKQNRNIRWVVIATIVIVAAVAAGVFALNYDNSKPTVELDNDQQPGGTVAVLAQGIRAQDEGANPNDSNRFFKITLTEEWNIVSDNEEKSQCSDTIGKKTIATSGSVTLTIYEKIRPDYCNPSIIGDSLQEFTLTSGRLNIAAPNPIVFCTKEENPACPRGDGKLTLHIAEKDKQPSDTNQLFIIVEDTAIEDDLNAQAQRLLQTTSQITFN